MSRRSVACVRIIATAARRGHERSQTLARDAEGRAQADGRAWEMNEPLAGSGPRETGTEGAAGSAVHIGSVHGSSNRCGRQSDAQSGSGQRDFSADTVGGRAVPSSMASGARSNEESPETAAPDAVCYHARVFPG